MGEDGWSPPEMFDEYRLVRLLGRGAMGEVYLAHDSLLDRPVAVKFVQAAEDPAHRQRFFEEARTIAKLQHPNVVAIYRVAEVAGHPYLVSEYVRGRALDQLERPAPWRQVLDLAIDLARGLAAAHRCGVLHRDVKPANAMLSDDGRAKLLDFGLATMTEAGAAEPVVSPPRERQAATRHLAAIDATLSTVPREPLLSFGHGSPKRGVAGTPLYLAPELWRGDPASPRSDLYALGILLYELVAGTAPHRGIAMAELGEAIQQRDIPRLADIVAGVDPAFAAIVDRLVERDPGARHASADALLVALEEAADPTALDGLPDGNPYRGLAAFDAPHGALFFGRRTEIREVVDRMRGEAFVVVGGDSGTGKSSLCRAGVLPWLVDHDGWSRIDVRPGPRPLRALAAALATWTGEDEAELEAMLRDTPETVARAIRKTTVDRKLLLFIDQLEELYTLAEPGDAHEFSAALVALAVRTPSMRVLATARSDFLSRLAQLTGLGDEMSRGMYFLRPLAGNHIREAVVRPAAAKGVTFESESLIDTLVEQTEHAPGGLPLLQFTLAELWDARDVGARTIRADALAALGGVAGALTRHADRILAGVDERVREAARRLLLRLVTAEGTRARRSETELLADESGRGALEVLVRGRIVVANDAQYEIAHEALLASWGTLQDWLTRGAADHAVRVRVQQAAAEWERTGRPRDLLWARRQLGETKQLDALAPREAAFLAAGRRAIARRRTAAGATAAVVVIGIVAAVLAVRARAHHQLDHVIGEQVAAATAAIDQAREIARDHDAARKRAFELYDAQRWADGEDAWNDVEALAAKEFAKYRVASAHLEGALSLDPARRSLRDGFADLLFERMIRARRDHQQDIADELAGRLEAYDDGHRRAAVDAPAHVELDVPTEAHAWAERAGAPREPLHRGVVALRPGPLVIVVEAPGRVTTRLPVLLAADETVELAIAPPATAPADMVYVPPGRFLFGSGDSTQLRRAFLNAPPMHEVSTPGYLIGRHEVTLGDWIAFLDDLPSDERARRTPRSHTPYAESSLELIEVAPKRWRFQFTHANKTYAADMTQHVHYEHRSARAEQDWLKFPVAAISFDDATAYAQWLDRTKRLPGARLCNEYEWERAARGADGRPYPTGDALAPDDANIDVTYGRDPLAFGPDEVGSHPRSQSVLGVDDMAGNVWEWTRSVEKVDAPVTRGGGWYQAALDASATNREAGEASERYVWLGFRLCAEVPTP